MVSPDGVAPSRMVGVSASLNLPLHHKVQKFSSGTGSPGWSQEKGRKTVVVLDEFVSWKTRLVPRSDEFEGQGQCHQGQNTTFLPLLATWVQFMFGKTSLACSFYCVVCFCCVRFSFFRTMPRDWLGRTCPK